MSHFFSTEAWTKKNFYIESLLFHCLESETFPAPSQGQGVSFEDGCWLSVTQDSRAAGSCWVSKELCLECGPFLGKSCGGAGWWREGGEVGGFKACCHHS